MCFFKCISLDSWEKPYLEKKYFSCPYKNGIWNQANLVNYSDLDKNASITLQQHRNRWFTIIYLGLKFDIYPLKNMSMQCKIDLKAAFSELSGATQMSYFRLVKCSFLLVNY